jgi:putative restriction endonuclease
MTGGDGRALVPAYPGLVIGSVEWQLRLAIFEWLAEQRDREGEVFSWSMLKQGVHVLGRQVHLLGPQGIFKPAGFERPLSITTSPKGPYPDRFESETILRYAYRGTDTGHPDNVGLRSAMSEGVPLVYFHGFEPGAYLATAPVFIVGDEPAGLFFRVQADDIWAVVRRGEQQHTSRVGEDVEARRAYVTATVQRRLHQVTFRERVIRAYRDRCALCRLAHRELLDAAHITPDSDPAGEPVVANGLALCKLHHAAFDRLFFAVRPDYRVEVRPAILEETDGPMLIVGLQQIHGQRIQLPSRVSQHPDPERLARRYERFRAAS